MNTLSGRCCACAAVAVSNASTSVTAFFTLVPPLAVYWRSWFGGHALHRVGAQQPHRFLYCALELRIASVNDVLREILHRNVRLHTFVLYRKPTIDGEKSKPRCNHGTAVDKRRRVCCRYKPTPRCRSNERPKL